MKPYMLPESVILDAGAPKLFLMLKLHDTNWSFLIQSCFIYYIMPLDLSSYTCNCDHHAMNWVDCSSIISTCYTLRMFFGLDSSGSKLEMMIYMLAVQ